MSTQNMYFCREIRKTIYLDTLMWSYKRDSSEKKSHKIRKTIYLDTLMWSYKRDSSEKKKGHKIMTRTVTLCGFDTLQVWQHS